jgi:glycosyltransferase involved in cell wall biosynthesis
MTQIKLPSLRKVDPNKPKKKKILLLSDDLRMHSGIATVSREIILNTVKEYDWVQLGAALKHPDQGKVFDISTDVQQNTGVEDANVRIYCNSGYGHPDLLRELIQIERPDAILHFTDPRFWGWLYSMEHELRQSIPLLYYTIWDDIPYPKYNQSYYESCDLLMCISKQTHNIVKQVLKDVNYKDWQITYVPHGINQNTFKPITLESPEWSDYNEYKKKVLPVETNFTVFYNARNIRRKHTSDLILAYKEFCDKLGTELAAKCLLLLHTDAVDENGTDLLAVIKELCPMYPIKFTPDRLVSAQQLNYLYNMVDVTANIASNEGFGLGTAESVMAGTPIVVNVTGGLQDQCGFKKGDGQYLTEYDYTDAMPTNALRTYELHGEWVEPVFPAVRTLQGSVQTPYIFDDIADYRDCAGAIFHWWMMNDEDRKEAGRLGREHFLKEETGLSAANMGDRFIKDINTMFEKWQPRKRTELVKI